MDNQDHVLKMELSGNLGRQAFLHQIRAKVMYATGELGLGYLINEIAKNIYDHAEGKGYLEIIPEGDSFKFLIKDHGEKTFDFEFCKRNSTKAGNGINFGTGLECIGDYADSLGIELHIDTSKGFSYSGIYTPNRR